MDTIICIQTMDHITCIQTIDHMTWIQTMDTITCIQTIDHMTWIQTIDHITWIQTDLATLGLVPLLGHGLLQLIAGAELLQDLLPQEPATTGIAPLGLILELHLLLVSSLADILRCCNYYYTCALQFNSNATIY